MHVALVSAGLSPGKTSPERFEPSATRSSNLHLALGRKTNEESFFATEAYSDKMRDFLRNRSLRRQDAFQIACGACKMTSFQRIRNTELPECVTVCSLLCFLQKIGFGRSLRDRSGCGNLSKPAQKDVIIQAPHANQHNKLQTVTHSGNSVFRIR